jgi:hypothetical protein
MSEGEPPTSTLEDPGEGNQQEASDAVSVPPAPRPAPLPPHGRQSFRRARDARLAALRLASSKPHDPVWASAGLLLREAIHWALIGRCEIEGCPACSQEEGWALLEEDLRGRLQPADLDALRSIYFATNIFAARARDTAALSSEFDGLSLLLQTLLERDPFDAHDRRRLGALLLKVAAVAGAIAIVISGVLFWQGRAKNLALNAPTRSSSTWKNYTTTNGAVDGLRTGIGFHTDQQQGPWLEIDLGAVKTIKAVHVYNSLHCCEERANPLVIEVSNDRRSFRQVARHEGVFEKWVAKLPTTQTRYVRVTVPKETYLHLSEIEVY